MKRLSLIAAMLCAGLASAQAEVISGLEAFAKGDYRKAALEWQPLSDGSHPGIQLLLATMYDTGRGLPLDYDLASQAYVRAAERSSVAVDFILGQAWPYLRSSTLAHGALAVLFYNEAYLTNEYGKAWRWARRAAEAGMAPAQTVLAEMQMLGKGATPDERQAVCWYLAAAEQGYARAQGALAALFADGDVVPKDDVAALTWATLAARQGFAPAAALHNDILSNTTPLVAGEAAELIRTWSATNSDWLRLWVGSDEHLLLLAEGVHGVLQEYIDVHDAFFANDIRRILPAPGIFQRMPFDMYSRELASLRAGLSVDIASVHHLLNRGNQTINKQDVLSVLEDYASALLVTISQLHDISVQLDTLASGRGNYTLNAYESDLDAYMAFTDYYRSLGHALNDRLDGLSLPWPPRPLTCLNSN